MKVNFVNEVHLHMKGRLKQRMARFIINCNIGSRDPYELRGYGAGFALCWKGSPSLLVGQPNDAGELIQVKSDSMLVIVPKCVLHAPYCPDARSNLCDVALRTLMGTESRKRHPPVP